MGVNGIYGLSGSGLDIDSMVKVGMMSKQNEYDKMAQKYTKNEWMKSAYIELSSSISTFNLTKLSDYKMSSSMSAKSATSSSDAVKATASGSAEFRTHSVEVTNLVSNAALVGTNKMQRYAITSGTADQSSIKLADVLFNNLTKVNTKDDNDNDVIKVYGQVAAVKMTADGRTTSSAWHDDDNRSITNPYTLGKTNTQPDFDTAVWSATSAKTGTFTADGDFSTNEVTWYNDSDNFRYDDASNSWQEKVLVTDSNGDPVLDANDEQQFTWVSFDPDFNRNATWDYSTNNRFTATNGFYTDAVTWTTTSPDWIKESGTNNYSKIGDVIADDTTVAFEFKISDGTNSATISFSYEKLLGLNGETEATFYDLADAISKAVDDDTGAKLNIKASYDADYDRFSFYNTENGSGNDIKITLGNDAGVWNDPRASLVTRNFFNNMGLYQSVNGKLVGYDKTVDATEDDNNALLFKLGADNTFEGQDATIKIDGMSYKSSDNKITKDGITYEAVDETTSPARVSVSQDVDAIVDKVKSFVEDYNKLLSSLYAKYDEKPDSNYKPLTQAQKDAMKDEQVEKWEEKAKKGILYHDQTIGKIILNMRSAVSNQIELDDGSTISAYNIGISTVAGNIKGQIQFDETKLRAALAEDPDAVYKVFASLDANDNTNAEKMGIAQRLGDVFTAATKSIRTRAGSSTDVTEDSDLNNLLRQLQTKMSNFKKMMDAFEDKLYKKYDSMESMLAKLGTQLNFISGAGQG